MAGSTKKPNEMGSRLEGTGASKFIQLMRRHGYNNDTDFELATVTSISPIQVKVNDGSGLVLDSTDLIVAWTMTARNETMTISGTQQTVAIASPLSVGDVVILASVHDGQLYYLLDKAVTS